MFIFLPLYYGNKKAQGSGINEASSAMLNASMIRNHLHFTRYSSLEQHKISTLLLECLRLLVQVPGFNFAYSRWSDITQLREQQAGDKLNHIEGII